MDNCSDLIFPVPGSVLAKKLAARRLAGLADPDLSLPIAQRARVEEDLEKCLRIHRDIGLMPSNRFEDFLRANDAEQEYCRMRDAGEIPWSASIRPSVGLDETIQSLNTALYGDEVLDENVVRRSSRLAVALWLIAVIVVGVVNNVPSLILLAAAAAGTGAVAAASVAYRRRPKVKALSLGPDDFHEGPDSALQYLDPSTPEGAIGARLDHVVEHLLHGETNTALAIGRTEAELRNDRDEILGQLANCQARRSVAAAIAPDVAGADKAMLEVAVSETTERLRAIDADVGELEQLYQSYRSEQIEQAKERSRERARDRRRADQAVRRERARELLGTLVEPPHAQQWTQMPGSRRRKGIYDGQA